MVECPACGDVTPENNNGNDVTIRGFCEHCARNFFRCNGCRRITSNRNRSTRYTTYCNLCYPSRFSYSPIGDPPWLGWELEVESDHENFDNARRETLRALPQSFATVKDDGSLSEYGFEIVSRPASYVEHVQACTPFFEAYRLGKFGQLTSWSNTTCGLHVHICRHGDGNPLDATGDWTLSQHSIALLVCFVNLPRNRRFVQCIAGRDANHYTSFFHKRMATAHQRTGEKYEAVNLEHSATLEFRIFKGTLKAQSFFKALEFVLALSEFCRSMYNVRKALNVSAFIRYVREKAETYPHLDSFISNRWYGKPDRNGKTLWRLVNNRKPPPPPIQHGSATIES